MIIYLNYLCVCKKSLKKKNWKGGVYQGDLASSGLPRLPGCHRTYEWSWYCSLHGWHVSPTDSSSENSLERKTERQQYWSFFFFFYWKSHSLASSRMQPCKLTPSPTFLPLDLFLSRTSILLGLCYLSWWSAGRGRGRSSRLWSSHPCGSLSGALLLWC